jgi:hypothetical protein
MQATMQAIMAADMTGLPSASMLACADEAT